MAVAKGARVTSRNSIPASVAASPTITTPTAIRKPTMGVTLIIKGFKTIVTTTILTDGRPAISTYLMTRRSPDSMTWTTMATGKMCRARDTAGTRELARTGCLTVMDRGTTINLWDSRGFPMSDGGGRPITTADGPASI